MTDLPSPATHSFWLAAASLALTRAMLTAVGVDGDLLAKWVVASGAFVDAFEIIAKHGYIQYWQDTLGVTLYSMGEFSVKVRFAWLIRFASHG